MINFMLCVFHHIQNKNKGWRCGSSGKAPA
jgi:hypothetical protein